MPTELYNEFRMLAMCPGDFIRPLWTTSTAGAAATFSPHASKRAPVALARCCKGGSPANWWERSWFSAISAECARAASARWLSHCSLSKPAFSRSWLTRSKSCCSACDWASANFGRQPQANATARRNALLRDVIAVAVPCLEESISIEVMHSRYHKNLFIPVTALTSLIKRHHDPELGRAPACVLAEAHSDIYVAQCTIGRGRVHARWHVAGLGRTNHGRPGGAGQALQNSIRVQSAGTSCLIETRVRAGINWPDMVRVTRPVEFGHNGFAKLPVGIGWHHMGKILSHVQSILDLHHPDPHGVVVGIHNVGAMSRRVHQGQMGFFYRVCQGHILRGRIETRPGGANALLQSRLSRKLVGEMTVAGQLLRVRVRRLRHLRVPLQLFQTGILPHHVHQLEELLLRRGGPGRGLASAAKSQRRNHNRADGDDGPVHSRLRL